MTPTTPRRSIQLLPEHLIDQIKAGEVIERPANVLKELIENALDAGAGQIDVELRDNGLGLIRVSDNGSGILAGEIPTAFGRHATSKIQRFEDLYRLESFGFRGEALPSIASVSKLECVSWTNEESEGGSLRFEGGLQGALQRVTKSGRPHGTVMSVQDLFFNTPARLKFLQSATSEKNWLKKFFYAFALAYPRTGFSLLWNEDERLIYAPSGTAEERIRQLFSAKVQERLHIHRARREWQGLICEVHAIFTNGAKSQGPIEHVLINRRPVLDKAYARVAQQILDKALLPEAPVLLISVDVPGDQVDVNVHPNKTLVKFHQMGEILSLVSATVREALPKVNAAPVSSPVTELPLPITPVTRGPGPQDLERDRGTSYAGHMQRMQETEPEGFELSIGTRLLFSAPGPYFIWQESASNFPYLVDGRALIRHWIAERAKFPAPSTPLLVSFPLRDTAPTDSLVAELRSSGFEVDMLEKNFHVVREIPTWAQGIPLALIVSCFSDDHAREIEFHEIPMAKWEEIWGSTDRNDCAQKKVIIALTPTLFGSRG